VKRSLLWRPQVELSEIEALRVQYLGKKGAITGQLKTLGQLPEADRPGAGCANQSGEN